MSSRQPLTILVTGATNGIGRHAALHFARAGHHVVATGRNAAALATLRAEAAGARLDVAELDVTRADSIAAAAAEVDRLTGGRGVDVLVNNAGYGLAGPLEEITDADLRAQFDTNVFGLMAVTRAFLPKMRARGAGRILNVSSIGGRITFPFFGAYHATKYALEAMTDALRLELAPFGIRVVAIEPGPIDTGFADRTMGLIEKYKSPTSPFAAIYARAQDLRKLTDRQAAGPEVVIRAMERAIYRRRPRARYVMPFSSRVLVALLRALPTGLVDWAMRRVIGLDRAATSLTAAPERLASGTPAAGS